MLRKLVGKRGMTPVCYVRNRIDTTILQYTYLFSEYLVCCSNVTTILCDTRHWMLSVINVLSISTGHGEKGVIPVFFLLRASPNECLVRWIPFMLFGGHAFLYSLKIQKLLPLSFDKKKKTNPPLFFSCFKVMHLRDFLLNSPNLELFRLSWNFSHAKHIY